MESLDYAREQAAIKAEEAEKADGAARMAQDRARFVPGTSVLMADLARKRAVRLAAEAAQAQAEAREAEAREAEAARAEAREADREKPGFFKKMFGKLNPRTRRRTGEGGGKKRKTGKVKKLKKRKLKFGKTKKAIKNFKTSRRRGKYQNRTKKR